MFVARTHDIQIEVEPAFIPEESFPEVEYYYFAYHVRILNLMEEQTIQLIHRHWKIRDGNQKEYLVDGVGVVGEQPKIRSGESYEYTSFCPLPTRTGSMRGHYDVRTEDGRVLTIQIPLIFLQHYEEPRPSLRELH